MPASLTAMPLWATTVLHWGTNALLTAGLIYVTYGITRHSRLLAFLFSLPTLLPITDHLRAAHLLTTGQLRHWHAAGATTLEAARWSRTGITPNTYPAWAPLADARTTDWDRDARHLYTAAAKTGLTPQQVNAALALPVMWGTNAILAAAFAAGVTPHDLTRLLHSRHNMHTIEAVTTALTTRRRRPTPDQRAEVLAWVTHTDIQPPQGALLPRPVEDITTTIRHWRDTLGPHAHLYAAAGLTLPEAVALQAQPGGANHDTLKAMAALRGI